MRYTFYGDLLGISGLYRLSPHLAYQKLNEFYNTTFQNIDENWCEESDTQIMMFSDSFFMWGNDAEGALLQLSNLYLSLLRKGLLLRGAIVDGLLQFDPRLERKNFRKMLPEDDTLARAVGLESTHKGARLLVEGALANKLLDEYENWLTFDGYIRHRVPDSIIPCESVLRRISPTPEGFSYEFLYFWECNGAMNPEEMDYNARISELSAIQSMLKDEVGIHYQETVKLIKRSKSRHEHTAAHVA